MLSREGWAALASLTVLALACARDPRPAPAEEEAPPPGDTVEIFSERAAEAGLDFHHFNGMTGEYRMAEVVGSGVALVDLDNDGDLDAYLIQGRMLDAGKPLAEALFPPRHAGALVDRLYRNDGEPGALRFTDMTAEAGFTGDGYGMGVAAGDVDNDGWTDLYVTNLGPNQLLRNQGVDAAGNPTFREVAAAARVDDDGWGLAATFFDYDRDGWLDLFVGNYVLLPRGSEPLCHDASGARDYCGPLSFPPAADRLYRNRGDGSFEDVTEQTGLGRGYGAAMGVVAVDFDGDGWLDLYVANDQGPNNLWRNHGDGTFSDEALLAGCAVNAEGQPEGSMGVDAGDFDEDGDFDLFMTHQISETNTLYMNDGHGLFTDVTLRTGLGSPSRPYTAFGTAWLDYDLDGRLDLLAVNGAVKRLEALARQRDPFPLHQPNQLFHNLGTGRFAEITASAGTVFALSEVSRGAAFGDVDNDGDVDVLISNNNGPARLLINQVGQQQAWIGVRLVSGEPPRDALGARASLVVDGRREQERRVRADGSYGSANDPRLVFALAAGSASATVRVVWPRGGSEEHADLQPGRYHTLHRGQGKELEP